MNNELTVKERLLGEKGRLLRTGWSRSMLLEYDKSTLPALRRLFRLKEWDSYFIAGDGLQLLLTAADLGYAGFVSALLAEEGRTGVRTLEHIVPLTFGSMDMPAASDYGDVIYRSKTVSLDFGRSPGRRYIRFNARRFDDVRSLYVNLRLDQPEGDTLCVSKGFQNKPDCFLYSHLIGAMPVTGEVVFGADRYRLEGGGTLGALNWGRGVLPSTHTGISLQCFGPSEDGHTLALSISDTAGAAFVDGAAVRFGSISLRRNDKLSASQWTLHSSDRVVDMVFTPAALSTAERHLGRLGIERQVYFGSCSGTIKHDGVLLTAKALPCCATVLTTGSA